jgi:hypothetical protein
MYQRLRDKNKWGPLAGIDVVLAKEAEQSFSHPIVGHSFVGKSKSRLVSPADYSLWLVTAELEDSTQLELPELHGEQSIYVVSGSLQVDGKRVCPQKGAVIIEGNAQPNMRAIGDTVIVHMGPTDALQTNAEPDPDFIVGDSTHVIGPRGTFEAIEPTRDTHYYADSTCDHCRLTLLYTSRSTEYVSATHSHSTDELIHLLWGQVRLGSLELEAGDTLAVAKDKRYGFRSGPNGFGFLNYRQGPSEQIVERGSTPRVEGGLVNGLHPVMDLIQ